LVTVLLRAVRIRSVFCHRKEFIMLVLSRKLGEKVFVSVPGMEDIVVTVVDIDRGKIRLGFQAPPSVKIMREELKSVVKEGE
jgi:carbon storage regulator